MWNGHIKLEWGNKKLITKGNNPKIWASFSFWDKWCLKTARGNSSPFQQFGIVANNPREFFIFFFISLSFPVAYHFQSFLLENNFNFSLLMAKAFYITKGIIRIFNQRVQSALLKNEELVFYLLFRVWFCCFECFSSISPVLIFCKSQKSCEIWAYLTQERILLAIANQWSQMVCQNAFIFYCFLKASIKLWRWGSEIDHDDVCCQNVHSFEHFELFWKGK